MHTGTSTSTPELWHKMTQHRPEPPRWRGRAPWAFSRAGIPVCSSTHLIGTVSSCPTEGTNALFPLWPSWHHCAGPWEFERSAPTHFAARKLHKKDNFTGDNHNPQSRHKPFFVLHSYQTRWCATLLHKPVAFVVAVISNIAPHIEWANADDYLSPLPNEFNPGLMPTT